MNGRLAPGLMVGMALLAGCSSPGDQSLGVDFSHVHGLGYIPATNTILVATHHGLIVGNQTGDSWTWAYAGSERYDYMGFTQDSVNPNVLYSSGHPDDPRAYGGVHLGVRRSTDAGATWEQRSLKGQVDFHSLSSIPEVEGGLVGVWKDTLMESRDGGLTWVNHTIPGTYLPFDVAITDHHVYVASADGLLAGHMGNATSWKQHGSHGNQGTFYAIASAADGSVMFAGTGNGRSGATLGSRDNATTWQTVENPLLAEAAVPAVFAFDPADSRHVFAATIGGDVLASLDAGSTWQVLRRA
ncbi:MAG: hypothetical protein ACYC2H_00285 [Thermoplasmatota archaeon]